MSGLQLGCLLFVVAAVMGTVALIAEYDRRQQDLAGLSCICSCDGESVMLQIESEDTSGDEPTTINAGP